MGPVAWCAIGVILGWFAGRLGSEGGSVNRIEAVVVAIFGAFVGGEFLSFYVLADTGKPHAAQQVGLAAAGAIGALLLLLALRKAVGPAPKKTKKRRA